MNMNPQNLRTIGTVGGVLIFGVPLVLMYVSISDWREELPESEIRRTGSRPPGVSSVKTPTPRIKPKPDRTPVRLRPLRPSPGERISATSGDRPPFSLAVRKVSPSRMKLVFINDGQEDIPVAIPRSTGALCRIVPADERVDDARPPEEPVYVRGRDRVVPLAPDDVFICFIDSPEPLPGGPLKLVYDSRGSGLPRGAWWGRIIAVESM